MTEFSHGFRVDPMWFVEEGDAFQAAPVRTFVYDRPKEGDAGIIGGQIEKMLAEQKDDGTFGGNSKDTGSKLLRLLKLDFPKDRPEVARAAEAILRQVRAGENENEWYERDGEVLSIYALHALCLLDMRDEPEVPRSLTLLDERQEEWNDPGKGCPWTPEVFWSALWAGRGIVPEVEAAVNDGLRLVTEQMNAAGCCGYNDPWGFAQAAGKIDSPEARSLVAKQIPMILRGQGPDGGWGRNGLTVFRALETHGFFKELADLPPLPADWNVVREVPIPEGKWFSLTWDGDTPAGGGNLWSFDHASGCAVALSPEDGGEVKRVKIVNCGAVAWWDGALAAVGRRPKELKRVDPETGAVERTIPLTFVDEVIGPEVVGDRLLVGDGFNGSVWIIDPSGEEKRRLQTLAGPGPACLAAEGDAVWHSDYRAPAIIKSDLGGNLLDWGEKPFDVRGLAFDGKRLWALDNEKKRICVIEKAQGS